jgi:hypothetical protein
VAHTLVGGTAVGVLQDVETRMPGDGKFGRGEAIMYMCVSDAMHS